MRDKFKYPKDWKLLSIASLADDSKELFDDGDWVEAEYLTDSGIRLIQTGNVGEGTFVDKEKRKYISEESYTKLKCKELIVGDILICRLADPAGRACILPNIGEEKMITSVDVSIYRPKLDFADRAFLVASMNTSNWFNEIRERCGGSTRTRIARSELGKIKIPLPPLPEQKAIVQVLSTADAAIHITEKLIAQKELRKKWLMQQLLTGKKRLMGFEGEWKEQKLEYFIKDYKQKPTEEDNYEVLTSAKSGLLKQTEYYGDNRITNRDDADYNVIPPNYLTYRSRSDDGLFTFNKNNLGITGLISGYYPVFSIKNGNINFILMYMNYYRQKLTKYAIGTSQLVLAMNALKEAKFHLPLEEEQTAIAKVLQAADKEINLLKAKVKKFREQKIGLIQQLLTGKKRLQINK